MVEGLLLDDNDLCMNSYNLIKKEITSSTCTMTSIPQPLKFLRLHYDTIKSRYAALAEDVPIKKHLSDLLAVIVMAVTDTEDTQLQWVLSGTRMNITDWGQEFLRSLSADIAKEYEHRLSNDQGVDELYDLVNIIVPFLVKNHSENDAIDLLIEVEKLNGMLEYVNENNYKKICLYLLANANYAADTEEYRAILELVYSIYFNKFHEYVNALRVAIKIGNMLYIKQTFNQCNDPITKKQLAFILAREKIFLDNEDDELKEIMANEKLSDYYKRLGNTLEVLEPKHPEDFIKSHLEEKKSDSKDLQSYKINMALSIASSFINAGFGTEVLLSKEGSNWLYSNKDEGLSALIAGLGLVYLWDGVEGPEKLYEYANNTEKDIDKRVGRNIGLGMCFTGIHDDNDTAIAALIDELKDKNLKIKISALIGIGLAAAGTQNDELQEPLFAQFKDFSYGFELSAFVCLAFGLIYLGSAKDDIFDELFTILLTRNDGNTKLMESPFFVIYALGMGLLCLGKQKDIDLMIETLFSMQQFSSEMRYFLKVIMLSFAYANSGNVSKVQELMHLIAEPSESVDAKVRCIAVFGCSLIALGESVGSEMLIRSFNHFLQFGGLPSKKSVPLAMAILNLSDPKVTIVDSIMKFCYDTDKAVAINAIFGLGLVGAGTNHSRVAGALRGLAGFYADESDILLVIRIAQGMLHMGKGMLTLNPIYSHKLLLNNVGMAGVLITIYSFLEAENLICGKYPFLLYFLSLAMQPRMIMCLDEKLQPVQTPLLVGQAVDTVGQTGNPRTVSGFQIHKSPALLATGERCEISGEDYSSYSDVMENIVIVKEKQLENK